jgi:tetraprenyl-beta-curcumene synthase
MSNLSDCIHYKNTFAKNIYPVVSQRINEYRAYTNRINKPLIRTKALDALDKNEFDIVVASVYSLYPDIDVNLATEVIFAFQAILRYLNIISEYASASTEPFFRLIFSSLKDAANLRGDEFIQYFTFFPSKDDDGYLSILVEKCRQKVRLLPAYDVVRDYISACLTLFIDLQVTKYSFDGIDREKKLKSWSCIHGQKYPDMSVWEFCMSVDSPLTLQLLFALATNPELTSLETEGMYNAFFPWFGGLQKILEGYLDYNDNLHAGNSNDIFYYENLKDYESRTNYFKDRAADVFDQAYPPSIVKILLSTYLTLPKANKGMSRLTSKALLRTGGKGMFLFNSAAAYIRSKFVSSQI